MHLEGVAKAGVVVAMVMLGMTMQAPEVTEDAEVVEIHESQKECSALCTLSFA